MNFVSAPAPACPDAAVLAARLAALFAPLLLLVAARFRVLGHWTVPIWTRLNRAARRLPRLLAQPAARPARRAPDGRAAHGTPPIRLPSRHGFLLERLHHEAAFFTNRLNDLLAEPASIALLTASPAAMASLRPFCRLLGVTLPPALRPSRPVRAPRPLRAPDPVLPSGPRLGRNPACPSPTPPPAHAASPSPVPPTGCYCANPAAAPSWPFPRANAPPPDRRAPWHH